jgi:hypothetical protein
VSLYDLRRLGVGVRRELTTPISTGSEKNLASVAASSADTQVAEVFTNSLATSLCASGTPLDYYIYTSVNHRGSVEASFVDYSNWLQQLLSGRTPPSTCSTGPVVENSP